MRTRVSILFVVLTCGLCCRCVEFEVLSITDTLWDGEGTETKAECSEDNPDTQKEFFPDCDGDGVFDSVATMACDIGGANAAFDCLDGGAPDGGWSLTPGTDCNDEDATVSSNGLFYPDCDGDGVFSASPTKACGSLGADLAFDCLDGADPRGGWAKEQGDDCNDEDGTGSSFENWYHDCDKDGLFGNLPVKACGALGADAAFDCSDGGDPDGGWSSTAGSDCNDDGKNTC